MDSESAALELAPSKNGRVSGKSWKLAKTPTVRSHLQDGVKTKSWEDRVNQTKKAQAIKKLELELKDEKQADVARHVFSYPPRTLVSCFL
ncbi:hypothetical protein DFH06DRAFT_1329330 [Mycena polygramma]|nr:hypothetical protein DFH06DRAFT_1329330 [Mycena polygramma]